MKNKYNILDEVYHLTPESPKGIIVDWTYRASTNQFLYTVAWGFDSESTCCDYELSKSKRYAG